MTDKYQGHPFERYFKLDDQARRIHTFPAVEDSEDDGKLEAEGLQFPLILPAEEDDRDTEFIEGPEDDVFILREGINSPERGEQFGFSGSGPVRAEHYAVVKAAISGCVEDELSAKLRSDYGKPFPELEAGPLPDAEELCEWNPVAYAAVRGVSAQGLVRYHEHLTEEMGREPTKSGQMEVFRDEAGRQATPALINYLRDVASAELGKAGLDNSDQ